MIMTKTIRPNLLSRNQAANYLGISLPTLSKLTNDGAFRSYRIGNLIKYKVEDLESALKTNA